MTRLTWVLVLAAAAGCGSDPIIDVNCDPVCPGGFHCTAQGCVADDADGGGALDFAPAVDLAGCEGRCSGATPVCNASGNCVACGADADCPIGSVCKTLSPQASVCVPGCSDDARCGAPGGLMRCCGGQCTDASSDSRNCGSCGTACMSPQALASCQGGRCMAGVCRSGWGDCNNDPVDGCEANLRVDTSNCGACGVACKIANGVAGCDRGGCYLKACLFGFEDCNSDPKDGCEVAVTSDLRNCGACAAVCPNVPHGKPVCANGSCQLASCDAGFADCDGKPANGCEVTLANDVRNCSACGMACGAQQVCVNGSCTCQQCFIPNARSRCVNLMCVFDSCVPGYANCDGGILNGCEVDTTSDAKNCGGCGMACPNGQNCQNAVCVACIPRPAGAVSFWTGEGNADDVLGGNHGVAKGGTRYGPGVVGQAFLFDGTGQVVAPSAGLPVGGSDRTLELWARIDVNVASEAFFAGWGGFGNQTQAYELFALNNLVQFSQWGAGVAGPNIQVGQWTHVAAVTQNGSTVVYANGVAGNPANIAINTPQGSSFLLGLIPIDNTRRLSGAVDEITVYNRALSAMEIQAIHKAGAIGKCR